MQRRAVWVILAGLVVGVLLDCAGLGALGMRRAGDTALAAARARWNARALAHYRLVVRETTGAGACQQDLEIDAERIVAVRQNQCVRVPSWTVANLFTWVASMRQQDSGCYPSPVTCVCHIRYAIEAHYDPEMGYPLDATYLWHLETNWAYWGHWERFLRTYELPDCAAVSRRTAGAITISVVKLTPLP
ncbi:hypothetical protein SE17_41780 [Kouleothrix aurantiaca]|uniref:Uncharacterized protein n=1 Tax=Kouleothrix aurantiaca TaxID=186479 RepID=A0A0P9D4R4_9CHLR|nr:hypothetical protein SE17_41780 [Kouleothrix aurantiaca]